MSETSKKRILVIGAGASGLVAIKSCKEAEFEVVCYEKSDHIGGIWKYNEEYVVGETTVMKTTIGNSSKEMGAFSDFPPEAEFSSFMSPEEMIKYFDLYIDHFDFRSCIHYQHQVLDTKPSPTYDLDGSWSVSTLDIVNENVKNEIFDGIMVCTGHHSEPLIPTFKNSELFSGKILHSQQYKTFKEFENKTVLVVGAGSSGVDIATDLAGVNEKVYYSIKRHVWFYPRYHNGKAMDIRIGRRHFSLQPKYMMEKKIRSLLNSNMDHGKFGLQPSENVSSQHPTVSDDLKSKLESGRLILKKNIKEFTDSGVLFEEDETVTEIDVVIFATGYTVRFPFLSEEFLKIDDSNKVSLYKNMFLPELKFPSLVIIGLVQPNGALYPVFEIQARWFAALMANKCRPLPNRKQMEEDIKKTEQHRLKTYVQTPRHQIEINRITYMDYVASQFGAKPNFMKLLLKDPKLFLACFKGPCLPYQYRLNGLYKWSEAREAILTYKSRISPPSN